MDVDGSNLMPSDFPLALDLGFNPQLWLPGQQPYYSQPQLAGPSTSIPYSPMGMPYNSGQPSQVFYQKKNGPKHERVNIIDTGSGKHQPRHYRGNGSGSGSGTARKKRQAIHQAVQAGSLQAVKLLHNLDRKCINMLTGEGINTVWIAAQGGHGDILKFLIEHGVDVNTPATESNRTPIHQAAQNGHLRLVKLLLENGAEPDPVDSSGITPFWSAAQEGHYDIAKILLENNANLEVESLDGSRRPIHQAAQGGHTRVVKLLLDNGAEPDPTDNSGISPLWSAAQQGHYETVRLLLKADASVDVTSYDGSRQPIHQAAQNGHLEVVQLLLEFDANATPENDSFEDTTPSPFWLACASAKSGVEIAKLLLDKGADVNFSVARSGKKPIHAAAHKGNIDVARLLIARKCDVDSKESDGWTALMIASQEGHLPFLNLLVESGAKVDAEEKDGATSLWIASQQGHTEIVRRLLDLGAKQLPTRSAQRRPIHQAAQNGHLPALQMLLKKEPNGINAEDKSGATPLLLAAQENQPNYLAIMNHLVSHGAKASV
ncbi:ankyrin-3 [Phialemonium atrogriseum]|uniref:Ankyrin-3 n=1 Tax=Phialemonium atrogriseum TaxID=1093897 RepID=A0AAJ0BRX0_9PEZI|nr:ankyrin-3 [Phialemonium atrogriseum]KAK1762004.1 ankyrin-3 [Phialemonium atrogriseum]